ncbi:hypothetical protein K432DRAFT_385313 [Lepidopterella palustris CBS 459.81]|uniref:C2H2 type master regulator of conidiophore development brlA n=1 Tax=Lepidopterella palustris CBS 459.81 TaxID=1314670 RepID=A0A8E2E3I4_9PEZI|nr:hypothetical protein K432DRAFT_385313 [Lepidopterella palustris CBS 459.81]
MSPFQRTMKHSALGQSPTYPSPARSDSDAVGYPDGLGLYNYSISYSAAGVQCNTALYPPSPQPTETWSGHITTGTSPLMTDAHADSWPTGLYDPPVSRSPWNPPYSFATPGLVGSRNSPGPLSDNAFSHRSSVSSSNDASIYSRADSEAAFGGKIKLEGPHEWLTDEDSSPNRVLQHQSLTVSPERLSTNTFPYAYGYGSPNLAKIESPIGEIARFETKGQGSSAIIERRRSSNKKEHSRGSIHRTRIRRNPTTIENANFSCDICGKLFQRSYNHKSHMEIHDPSRSYPNHCPYQGCSKKFVRRTDLLRHEQSVHIKAKNHKCSACDSHFARKDTLRRHEEDGCPKRHEIRNHSLPTRIALQKAPGRSDAQSLRPAGRTTAGSRSPSSPLTQLTPLFKDGGFPTSPTGY